MEVQPQLILLQKTLLNVEGLGRDLYPELDIWQTASPILRESGMSVRQVFKDLRRQLPELIQITRSMPTVMKTWSSGPAAVATSRDHGERPRGLAEEIRRSRRRSDQVLVGAAILFGGLLWSAATGGQGWPRMGVPNHRRRLDFIRPAAGLNTAPGVSAIIPAPHPSPLIT